MCGETRGDCVCYTDFIIRERGHIARQRNNIIEPGKARVCGMVCLVT